MNYFVYVVCGGKEYIEQLNLSLKFLRYFSRFPAYIITDRSRNQAEIEHDEEYIIDVNTPSHYDNNTASIYLETQIHRILDTSKDQRYCYLDSDIIAVNGSINEVFDYTEPWPRFARDHCTLQYHSPVAMKCDCNQLFDYKKERFEWIHRLIPQPEKNEYIKAERDKLLNIFTTYKSAPIRYVLQIFKFLFNRYLTKKSVFYLTPDFYFLRKSRAWYNRENELIDYDKKFYLRVLRKKFKIYPSGDVWVDKEGKRLIPETPYCDHLQEYLQNKYSLDIPSNFRHWNGGMFLFDKRSLDALDTWHKLTLNMFYDKSVSIKYIDQLSLIVTAFRHGFYNKPFLPFRFNFITDFGNKKVRYQTNKGYTYNNFQTIFQPAALHIYHHWNDKNWSIWQAIIEIAGKENITAFKK